MTVTSRVKVTHEAEAYVERLHLGLLIARSQRHENFFRVRVDVFSSKKGREPFCKQIVLFAVARRTLLSVGVVLDRVELIDGGISGSKATGYLVYEKIAGMLFYCGRLSVPVI